MCDAVNDALMFRLECLAGVVDDGAAGGSRGGGSGGGGVGGSLIGSSAGLGGSSSDIDQLEVSGGGSGFGGAGGTGDDVRGVMALPEDDLITEARETWAGVFLGQSGSEGERFLS